MKINYKYAKISNTKISGIMVNSSGSLMQKSFVLSSNVKFKEKLNFDRNVDVDF